MPKMSRNVSEEEIKKRCNNHDNTKLSLKTSTDLVHYSEEQASIISQPMKITCVATQRGSSLSVADECKNKTWLKKAQNQQDLFKNRVSRAKTKSEFICRNCEFHEISKPRDNMPLVVIDFDSIIIKPLKENALSKNFAIIDLLEGLYPYYNIGMWSSLPMKEFLDSLEECDALKQRLFKVCFCLDNSSMITAFVPLSGNTKVKALHIVWTMYPQFHRNNSVMIDETLKKMVLKPKGATINPLKESKYLNESDINQFVKYLIDFFKTAQSFSKLNKPTWKLSWNEKL